MENIHPTFTLTPSQENVLNKMKHFITSSDDRCFVLRGYAVTCHKAQGGEWRKVYIDFGRHNFFLNPTKESYQWLYTALTRAKQQACFVSDFYFK